MIRIGKLKKEKKSNYMLSGQASFYVQRQKFGKNYKNGKRHCRK